MNQQGEIKRLLRAAELAGWRVEAGTHWRLYPTDKTKRPITISRSPSDNYAVNNILRDLRRAGLNV